MQVGKRGRKKTRRGILEEKCTKTNNFLLRNQNDKKDECAVRIYKNDLENKIELKLLSSKLKENKTLLDMKYNLKKFKK